MAPTALSVDQLRARVGSPLGFSEWHQVTQEEIDLFAKATGDYQWIHTDRERARQGPFGTTIAHGYLTLSLASALLAEVLAIEGPRFIVNYGLNRVRFPAPVPVGSRLRVGAVLESLEAVAGGGHQATLNCTFELEGSAKPACVADVVFRYYG
ncbi:MAG: MaoC family dehydratase [Acidimicrobiales bacterium]